VVKGSDKNLHQMFFFALPFPVQVTHPTLSQILIYFLYPVAHAAITISETRLLLWLVVLSLQKVDQVFPMLVTIKFDKNGVGPHFGQHFENLIWSQCSHRMQLGVTV
jgi:hypothetical protein